MFPQITIIGTGLIGGSFALAVKKRGLAQRIVGCDRGAVLAAAEKLGAIDSGSEDPAEACRGSQVVLLATPVGGIIDLLERLGPLLPAGTLLTDVGSTKAEIMDRARAVFGAMAAERFLGGHPMAGKEHSGIEHADADLFAGAVWLITPTAQPLPQKAAQFARLLEQFGARVVQMDTERHDRLCAWISHLPQMLSTALAAMLREEPGIGDDPELAGVGGRALREMTRIAASPYSMWRDIAFTNTEEIADALLRLEQRLAHLRENLRTAELREEFERANRFTQELKALTAENAEAAEKDVSNAEGAEPGE